MGEDTVIAGKELLAHVHNLNLRHGPVHHALGQRQQLIASGCCAEVGEQGGRCAAKQQRGPRFRRAAQGNPWIFRDIRAAMQGMPYQPPTPMERVEMMMRHFDLETQIHGEHRGMLEMRKHIAWYVHGLRGAAKFRDMIVALDSPQAIQQAITEFARSQNDPAPSPSAEER